MLFTIFSVFYVLIAAALTVLILIQRGDGANAGASFGGGASGTVFGARGSASFLTRATAVLAALFFILSLAMGIYLSRAGVPKPQADLGVMAGAAVPAVSTTAAVAPGVVPSAAVKPSQQPSSVPPAPANNSEVPQATAPAKPAPKTASSGGH
ncbi:MAG TPA: preprotein translocase subunit SecG [Rhodanobacteraceae bacterium]|nr:preprotein translocase subunit SecG [Rhodanobacteraceae bacterium]